MPNDDGQVGHEAAIVGSCPAYEIEQGQDITIGSEATAHNRKGFDLMPPAHLHA
jgi:hypothetical protein